VGFTYTGLNPEEMEGRITTVYERSLTTLVDNIQHIESTSYNGLAIVKIFLQPNASIDTARLLLRHKCCCVSYHPVLSPHWS
jgi:multidrug efflux pump subunit AcrB